MGGQIGDASQVGAEKEQRRAGLTAQFGPEVEVEV